MATLRSTYSLACVYFLLDLDQVPAVFSCFLYVVLFAERSFQ